MIWIAYCRECGKEIDRGVNGAWIEAGARNHQRKTGHVVLVGYEAKI